MPRGAEGRRAWVPRPHVKFARAILGGFKLSSLRILLTCSSALSHPLTTRQYIGQPLASHRKWLQCEKLPS